MSASISVSRGGLAPIATLGCLFAVFAPAVGLSVGIAALLGAVGGTASLLVHEFGHVRAARRVAGIRSATVTLMWLGAATRFEGRYANGREQARVALGGPKASFCCALALLACCVVPVPFTLREMLVGLALFNVVLAVVNLLPVHPLDGHKLVVGLLWCATGSEQKARRVLRRIGIGWAAVEIPVAAVMVFEKPQFGLAAVVIAASFIVQKRLCRKPAA